MISFLFYVILTTYAFVKFRLNEWMRNFQFQAKKIDVFSRFVNFNGNIKTRKYMITILN